MIRRLLLVTFTVTSLLFWRFYTPQSATNEQALNIPAEYRERYDLTLCPPSELEREFSRNFPGVIETYHHNEGFIIFRQVTGSTRKLHDSSVCFKSGGFLLSSETIKADSSGRNWKHYSIQNETTQWHVRSIVLSQNNQNSWHDVGEWFWSALFSHSKNQYLAITEINE